MTTADKINAKMDEMEDDHFSDAFPKGSLHYDMSITLTALRRAIAGLDEQGTACIHDIARILEVEE